MATVDVMAEIDVTASPTTVAAVMFDPQRASEWMQAVSRVEVLDPALVPGARVRFHGSFMGVALTWTSEVVSVQFPHLLSVKLDDGPFVGTARYEVQRSPQGTHVRVRTSGTPSGLGFLPASVVEGPMRSALQADLERLRGLVEPPLSDAKE